MGALSDGWFHSSLTNFNQLYGMTNYRRFKSCGATYFFTVALADRTSDSLVRRISYLRKAVKTTMKERPFQCEAAVILPDHLHMIWTLPKSDSDFSTRWRLIKSRFSIATGLKNPKSHSQYKKQERGVWQRRFWEHCIRDEADFSAHVAYCWGNPVKHGLVKRPADWPFSSIHRDRRLGRVPAEWAQTQGDFGEP